MRLNPELSKCCDEMRTKRDEAGAFRCNIYANARTTGEPR